MAAWPWKSGKSALGHGDMTHRPSSVECYRLVGGNHQPAPKIAALLGPENDKADSCSINTKPDLFIFILKAKDGCSRLDNIRHETGDIGNPCPTVLDHILRVAMPDVTSAQTAFP